MRPGFFDFQIHCDSARVDLSRGRKSGIMREESRQKLVKTLDEIKQILAAQREHLATNYGVAVIGVFGSYVRDEQHPDSDLDILIELERPPRISLIGLVELEDYLTGVIGVNVDLAISRNLRKRIGARIRSEVVPV